MADERACINDNITVYGDTDRMIFHPFIYLQFRCIELLSTSKINSVNKKTEAKEIREIPK